MNNRTPKEEAADSAYWALWAISRYNFTFNDRELDRIGLFKGFKYYEILTIEHLLGRICNRLSIMSKEKKDG